MQYKSNLTQQWGDTIHLPWVLLLSKPTTLKLTLFRTAGIIMKRFFFFFYFLEHNVAEHVFSLQTLKGGGGYSLHIGIL